ncbi:MAG: DNA-deoxyinosine glycosylase [Methanomicrobiaceae archaeon]|nr:DNA-deoxyinosine glycosylase [Methanomicrobiaceae archaeon]
MNSSRNTGDLEGERREGLAPVIGPDPRVLILGSFPSARSLAAGEYYAHPQNAFWRIMEAIGCADPDASYTRRCASITCSGIALWDVVASCRREGSGDAQITDPVPNDIARLLDEHRGIRIIVLNGKSGAERWLKRFFPDLVSAGRPPVVTLPSTSPANARLTMEAKISAWRIVAEAARPPDPRMDA